MDVFLIIKKRHLSRGLSCNRLMTRRQKTELMGATKKVTCLFCHQTKLLIQHMRIWPFFIALESQLMKKMILHHITSLDIRINGK